MKASRIICEAFLFDGGGYNDKKFLERDEDVCKIDLCV